MSFTGKTVRDAVYGAAVGDALGVPYEFTERGRMEASPALDMVGNGTYNMPPGTWSDDTSMILCTLSTLDSSLDLDAVMKAFISWVDDGSFTPHGVCFDIGHTTRTALMNYASDGDVSSCGLDDPYSNGNGSLMRIIPVALYSAAHDLEPLQAVMLSHRISALTHAHRRSLVGCGIFTCIALRLIGFPTDIPSAVRDGIADAKEIYIRLNLEDELKHYSRLLDPGFACLHRASVKSSGYVLDTLECAVWCLLNSGSYRECVLNAVNFGADTDTAACVAGALAGIAWGLENIPGKWFDKLLAKDVIESAISVFCQKNGIE